MKTLWVFGILLAVVALAPVISPFNWMTTMLSIIAVCAICFWIYIAQRVRSHLPIRYRLIARLRIAHKIIGAVVPLLPDQGDWRRVQNTHELKQAMVHLETAMQRLEGSQ